MLKIIISPAKKMKYSENWDGALTCPPLLEKTEILRKFICGMSWQEAADLWKCNEKLAELNYQRFQNMNLHENLTPALLAYEGLQYQHMAPAVFEREEWEYVVRHLRILSGFYGMLSPTDGVLPYRLEMQARGNFPVYPGINAGGWKEQKTVHTLYEFWMDDIYSRLTEDEENEVEILNLASKEYSKAVEPYLQPADRFVTCIFGYLDADRTENPKVKVKGTEAKMARGEMVRYLAERRIENLEEVKLFSLMGYQFSPEWSDDNQFVFLKRITG